MSIKVIPHRSDSNQLEKVVDEWKSYGAVSTPVKIVDLMMGLSGIKRWKNLDILEPACGFCNFIRGIYSKYPNNNFYGIEINDEVYSKTTELQNAAAFSLTKGDFLLWNTTKRFDLIIGNPPYGIIGDGSHYPIHFLKENKEKYKKIFGTWFGKYNIYGAFIEKSVNLLKPTGKLVFIIPATWMILDEFSKLRKYLSYLGKVRVYYLGDNIFDGVNVSVCLLMFEKGAKGLQLYFQRSERFIKSTELSSWKGSILRFETRFTKNLEKGKLLLDDAFDIKISARSPEVRNFDKVLTDSRPGALPFMNGRNIKKGQIDRQNYTNLWLNEKEAAHLKHFYGIIPRIVVGHTKGGKIFAAIENEPYPYVGDVYHLLPKIPLKHDDLEKTVRWLNSQDLEKYTTTLYKEITPHTTATQLKEIPLNLKVDKATLF